MVMSSAMERLEGGIHYTDLFDDPAFFDVFLYSETGDKYGINRSVLASAVHVCQAALCGCSDDEPAHVSTNFNTEDLRSLVAFAKFGSPLNDPVLKSFTQVPPLNKIKREADRTAAAAVPELGDLEREDVSNLAKVVFYEEEEEEMEMEEDEERDDEDDYAVPAAAEEKRRQARNRKNRDWYAKNKKPNVRKREPEELYSEMQLEAIAASNAAERQRHEDPKDYFYFPSLEEVPRDRSLPYQCQYCARGFTHVEHFHQHFIRHRMHHTDENRAFTCLKCFEFTGTRLQTHTHTVKHCHEPREKTMFSFLCGFCNDILDNQQALKDHYESQHPMDEVDWAKETVCLACGMAFQKTLGLKRHFRQMGPHHSGQCSQCDVTVNTWDKMVRHVREAHGGKFACSNCQNIFDDDESLRSHKYRIGCRAITVKLADGTEVVTGQNTAIVCPYCQETCNGQKSAFQDHLVKCRPEVVWSCDKCDFKNLSSKIMQSHKKNVHDKVLVTCDICSIQVSKYYIKQHKLSMHADDSLKKFKCKICGRAHITEKLLKRHIKDTHQKEKKAKTACEFCGALVIDYKSHLSLRHSDKFKCPICGRNQRSEKSLAVHIASVHETAPCDKCGMEVSPANVKMHNLTNHTEETDKPFVCTHCDPPKGFVSKTKFQDHQNVHTGATPHSCKFCSAAFKDTPNLYKHIREVHKEEHEANRRQKIAKKQSMLML